MEKELEEDEGDWCVHSQLENVRKGSTGASVRRISNEPIVRRRFRPPVSARLSVYICPSVSMSVSLYCVCTYERPSLSVRPSVCLAVFGYASLYVFLSLCPSVYP